MRIRNVLFLSLMFTTPLLGQQPPPARPKPPDKVGEKPKPAADSLEAVIADAMRNNPDIRAAEAKVREAEANLNKVRSEVMVAVAAQQDIVKQAKETFQSAENIIAQRRQLFARGQLSQLEMLAAETEYQRAKSELVKVEADLHKLVGRVPGLVLPGSVGQRDAVRPGAGDMEWSIRPSPPFNQTWQSEALKQFDRKGTFVPMAMANDYLSHAWMSANVAGNSNMIEKIRVALDKPIPISKEIHQTPVEDVLAFLRDAAGKEVPFRALLGSSSPNPQKYTASLMPGELPLGAWLIAIQDENPNLVFLVREYGILVTTRDRAPKDAMPVAEFWRSSKPAKAKEEKKEQKK